MQNAPFLVKFPLALVIVVAAGIAITVATALQIYVLGWLLGIIGSLF